SVASGRSARSYCRHDSCHRQTQRPDGGIPLCTRIRGVGGHPVFLSGRRDYQHHCGPTTNKSGGWGPASNPLGGRGRTPGGRSSASNRFYRSEERRVGNGSRSRCRPMTREEHGREVDILNGTALDVLFFFSSRRRHTRSKRDWSSDVCSSDLHPVFLSGRRDYQHHCGPTTNKSGGWGPASNPLGGRGRTPGGRSSASNRFYSHGPTTPAHK